LHVHKVGHKEASERTRAQHETDDLLAATAYIEQNGSVVGAAVAQSATKSRSLNMDKVVLNGRLNALEIDVKEKKEEFEKKRDDARVKIGATLAGDGNQQSRGEMLSEVDDFFKEVKKAVESDVLPAIAAFRSKLDSVTSDEEYAQMKSDFESDVKPLMSKHKCVKAYIKFMQGLTCQVNKLTRLQSGAASAPKIASAVAAHKSPLWTILMNLPADLSPPNDSIFEAKGGFKAALLTVRDGTAFNKLVGELPVVKKGWKDLDKHIKSGHGSGVVNFQKVNDLKKVNKQLATLFSSDLFTHLALPSEPWAATVYAPMLSGTSDSHVNVGWTHYGVMEAAVFVSGKFAVMGVPSDKVPGDDFGEKRRTLAEMPQAGLEAMIKDGGFYYRHDDSVADSAGKCLVVPSGFVLVSAGDVSRSIRWGLTADDRDIERCMVTLKQLLLAFSELRGPRIGYQAFYDFLCSRG
jgi:hypothetical protein